jgi:nucleotide-binding universal stress UspA family protein
LSEKQSKTLFSKILVGIDGSQESIDASRYAISIAKKYKSELIAIFVLHTHAGVFSLERFEEEKKRPRNC